MKKKSSKAKAKPRSKNKSTLNKLVPLSKPSTNLPKIEKKTDYPPEALQVRLASLSEVYLKTSDPMAVLEAFKVAQEAGQNPPGWVLNYFYHGINDFLDGKVNSLDLAIGIKHLGKGRQTHPVEKRKREAQKSDLVFFMIILEEVFSYKAHEAINAVYKKHGPELMLSERTLMDLHAKNASRMKIKFHNITANMSPKETISLWQTFLKDYPKPSSS